MKKNTQCTKKVICAGCHKNIQRISKAIYVENDFKRLFCSDRCVILHFMPLFNQLHKLNSQVIKKNDLTEKEKQKYSYLRLETIYNPDKIFFQKIESGDTLYTLIKKIVYKEEVVWSICCCLFLDNTPSVFCIGLLTKHKSVAKYYSQGFRYTKKQLQTYKQHQMKQANVQSLQEISEYQENYIYQEFSENITRIDLQDVVGFLEYTLDKGHEIWSVPSKNNKGFRTFHLIGKYHQKKSEAWCVIIIQETNKKNEIELIDAFSTDQEQIVNLYRIGKQELPTASSISHEKTVSKIVH